MIGGKRPRQLRASQLHSRSFHHHSLYIKGDEIASSTSLKDSSFSGKAITAVGDAGNSGREGGECGILC